MNMSIQHVTTISRIQNKDARSIQFIRRLRHTSCERRSYRRGNTLGLEGLRKPDSTRLQDTIGADKFMRVIQGTSRYEVVGRRIMTRRTPDTSIYSNRRRRLLQRRVEDHCTGRTNSLSGGAVLVTVGMSPRRYYSST